MQNRPSQMKRPGGAVGRPYSYTAPDAHLNPVRRCAKCALCGTPSAVFWAKSSGGLALYRCFDVPRCGKVFLAEAPLPLLESA